MKQHWTILNVTEETLNLCAWTNKTLLVLQRNNFRQGHFKIYGKRTLNSGRRPVLIHFNAVLG